MIEYRSKFEVSIAKQLQGRATYESCKLKYVVPTKARTYTPDFVLDNGIIIECKGRFTVEDRYKMLLVKESNPELDIRLVFQNANVRLSKLSKTTYAMWADKHNFKWAHRTVPEEWLTE